MMVIRKIVLRFKSFISVHLTHETRSTISEGGRIAEVDYDRDGPDPSQ